MIPLLSLLHGPDLFGSEAEDIGQPVWLFPEEEALVQNSVRKRQREFALGRACARTALAKAGQAPCAIPKGANGAPLWPPGIVGSITHTDGYAACLLGLSRHWRGIGIDAERVGRVSRDLWPRLFTGPERDHLETLGDAAREATLLFSAKEACYKAWGGPLQFHDIQVTPMPAGFAASRGGEKLQGHYAVAGNLMVTAAWF